ncbi:MAG TPA: phytanoyl-CoA dioxygenase family protein [Acidimicrobiales bacterium]|nr:phytanoyl-CoA dioxygenase family protein [Acidimicrobiales bacterium]
MTRPSLLEGPPADYGEDEPAMARYRREGEARARALDNRGPLRLDDQGRPDLGFLDAYWRYGFYVIEGLLDQAELDDLESDIADVLDRAPVAPGAPTDRAGRPALGAGCRAMTFDFVAPLSDPVGGTLANRGRHPVKMTEPAPPPGAPAEVLQLIVGTLQFSDACLRFYGHPHLLAIAAAINGDDFAPFNEAIWIKHAHLGGSVAWHQDGFTYWDSPDLDAGTHGFNFMAQLYGCTPANGLWVVPGSHVGGKADITAMVAAAGSDRLPEAVPLVCGPGDVVITNRQVVHGSFANTSADPRITVQHGFHRRRSVLGAVSGARANPVVIDDARVRERSKPIMYGIDARAQRYPDEQRYVYQPFAGEEDQYRWAPQTKAALRDYNLLDLGI